MGPNDRIRLRNVVARNIRKLRTEKGWTQDQLARRISITRSSMGSYEEGRAQPPYQVLELMVFAFNLAGVEELMRENPKRERPSQMPAETILYNRYMALSPDKKKIVDFILNN